MSEICCVDALLLPLMFVCLARGMEQCAVELKVEEHWEELKVEEQWEAWCEWWDIALRCRREMADCGRGAASLPAAA